MIRKLILPLLAVAGLALAIHTVRSNDAKQTPAPPLAGFTPPFAHFVVGSGLVEANTTNIPIGTTTAGVVSKVYVQVGSEVKAGAPLFTLDDRALRSELAVRQAALQVATARLAKARYDLQVLDNLATKGVTPADDRQKQRYVVATLEAQGAQARAELEATQTDLNLLTVRAPADGEVLQLQVHPGQYAPTAAPSPGEPPLVLFGGVHPLHVRVAIDETDAWRVHAGTKAVGVVRGNPQLTVPLQFVRFEPYVVPKQSLTGSSTERVDTRVLQVIFRFPRGKLPIYVGQLMDVYVETPPSNTQ